MDFENLTFHIIPQNSSIPLSDMNFSLINFGFQDKDSQHNLGPHIKSEHVLQYVFDGEGEYVLGNKKYYVKSGDLFYLPKNTLLSYKSNAKMPYRYYWLGIDGVSAVNIIEKLGVSKNMPVKYYGDDKITTAFKNIGDALSTNDLVGHFTAIGETYKLFALLLSYNNENLQNLKSGSIDYVDKAINYIKNNFSKDLNVTQIASAIGLGRNYFSVIFHKHTGMPPVQYLMNYRIFQAKTMLESGFTITETAMSCGFNSTANFSAQFKRIVKVSPLKYKQSCQN